MGRKRTQGKARKAAKAKAEAEEVCGNASPHDTTITCRHGFGHLSEKDICFQYANAFREAYNYKNRQDGDANLSSCLIAAHKATTLDKFAEVGKDSDKMEWVISWFEQCTAVGLYKTQALINR
eukprot:scaffold28415_cov67-Skeletonema_dohrnii-CCMP3373.AAC.1